MTNDRCLFQAYWKPLLHAALVRFRDNNTKARFVAMRIVHDLFARIREPLLVLLPETIPYVAEAMEDEDSQCGQLVQDIIQVIEDVSGESLQDYLCK